MNIYIVSHYYDNGLDYEDYRRFEEREFYSTVKKASSVFWEKVTSDYEGKYELIRKTLDTQEEKLLEESAWIDCKPYCYDDYFQCDPEDACYNAEYDCYNYGDPDPCASIEEYWKWDKLTSYNLDDISEEEDRAWYEYVTTPGTNYQEWKECEEEIKKRKSDILFDELNSMLVELLK